MRLPKEKSKRVVDLSGPQPQSNKATKGHRKDAAPESNYDGKGSNERIYKTPEFRKAIEDVSSQFQSKTRTDGKKDREKRPALSLDEITKIFGIARGKKK